VLLILTCNKQYILKTGIQQLKLAQCNTCMLLTSGSLDQLNDLRAFDGLGITFLLRLGPASARPMPGGGGGPPMDEKCCNIIG